MNALNIRGDDNEKGQIAIGCVVTGIESSRVNSVIEVLTGGRDVRMLNVQILEQEAQSETTAREARSPWPSLWPWVAGLFIAVLVGSWLVWLSAFLQRRFVEEDIRTACHHVMPETAERCFDTVVIQRGGVRR